MGTWFPNFPLFCCCSGSQRPQVERWLKVFFFFSPQGDLNTGQGESQRDVEMRGGSEGETLVWMFLRCIYIKHQTRLHILPVSVSSSAIAHDMMAMEHSAAEKRHQQSNRWYISGYFKVWCISTALYHIGYYLTLPTLCPSIHIFSLNWAFHHHHHHHHRGFLPAGAAQQPPDSDVCPLLVWIQFNYDKKRQHLLGRD